MVVCLLNGEHAAGTRRVHQLEHARARADTRTRRAGPICRKNVIARARPCPPVPPLNLHGKEGVDGSSPSEGSAKVPQIGAPPYVFSRRGGPSGPVWSR